LTEALAADTVSTLVNGLRSAILRTNSASSSSSRGHQSRGHGMVSDDASRGAAQCKAMQTTLPHGRTLANSLKQVRTSNLEEGCRRWNSLPPDVTSASTLSVFRNRLKTYLFSRSFPS